MITNALIDVCQLTQMTQLHAHYSLKDATFTRNSTIWHHFFATGDDDCGDYLLRLNRFLNWRKRICISFFCEAEH